MAVSSAVSALPPIPGVEGGFAPLDSGLLVPRAYLPQIAGLLHNMAASTDPTVNDDSGDGYGVGSRWLNTTKDLEYVCLDATVAAAVWKLSAVSFGSAASAIVGNYESTTNQAYTDLATAGPAVTVTVGGSGLLIVLFSCDPTSGQATLLMSFALSGANSLGAGDDCSIFTYRQSGMSRLLTGLNAGSTTVTAKYRSSNGGNFEAGQRRIAAIPL